VIRSFFGSLAHKRISVVGMLVAIAAMAVAMPASASANEFSVFSHCPFSNPHTYECVYGQTTSGEVKIGNTTVPITSAITIQGGLQNFIQTGNTELIPASGAETLSKTPQTVPGGLLGIVAPESWPGWLQAIFNGFINEGATGVTATTELVGTASINLLAAIGQSGTAVNLPVRVKLSNPFLGSACYIGSSGSPIDLALTTGTTAPPLPNHPISGSRGTLSENAAETILFDSNQILVNNSFAAPGASGCGGIFELLVDFAVDLKLGLPSAAGNNTAILKGNQEIAAKTDVEAAGI